MPQGAYTRTWAHPESVAGFACLWRTEVAGARELGRRVGATRYLEVRYEDLVADPHGIVSSICAFAEIPFEAEMLDYAGRVDVSAKPHQQRLLQPPTRGVRNWRDELGAEDALAFEEVAGDVLDDLGYPLLAPPPRPPKLRARASLASYRTRLGIWGFAVAGVQRSPVWRRRHPSLE
jgi:hypothetical protein